MRASVKSWIVCCEAVGVARGQQGSAYYSRCVLKLWYIITWGWFKWSPTHRTHSLLLVVETSEPVKTLLSFLIFFFNPSATWKHLTSTSPYGSHSSTLDPMPFSPKRTSLCRGANPSSGPLLGSSTDQTVNQGTVWSPLCWWSLSLKSSHPNKSGSMC